MIWSDRLRQMSICATRSCMPLTSVCAFVGSRNSSTYFISRSGLVRGRQPPAIVRQKRVHQIPQDVIDRDVALLHAMDAVRTHHEAVIEPGCRQDRKSTRLNSSHSSMSY